MGSFFQKKNACAWRDRWHAAFGAGLAGSRRLRICNEAGAGALFFFGDVWLFSTRKVFVAFGDDLCSGAAGIEELRLSFGSARGLTGPLNVNGSRCTVC